MSLTPPDRGGQREKSESIAQQNRRATVWKKWGSAEQSRGWAVGIGGRQAQSVEVCRTRARWSFFLGGNGSGGVQVLPEERKWTVVRAPLGLQDHTNSCIS